MYNDYFAENNMAYKPIYVEGNKEAKAKLFGGECDVFTTDASGLASARSGAEDPSQWMVLPEIISKESELCSVKIPKEPIPKLYLIF